MDMVEKTLKRRKPASKRKEEFIRFRVSPSEKKRLEKAAEMAGGVLSSWLRIVALAEAARIEKGSKSLK